ncbi:23S rRNA (uracil(1939)-C(5))-methyltransferase RlmD [bacterium]|nr:MAG: 23S rRNA (uracil(1939)-C(5))-methyltransferase RlmD [bacterium]
MIEESPIRKKTECPYFGECGGCTFQHIPYQNQLQFKREIVAETMKRLGNFENVPVETVIPSPLQWEYRNKMEFAFGKNAYGVFAGLHRRGRYDVLLPVAKQCLLISKKIRQVCSSIEEMAQGEATYDPVKGIGYLRFLSIRRSFYMDKIIVGITVTQKINPEIFEFWFEELNRRFPDYIIGGYLTINPGGGSTEGEFIPMFGDNEFIEKLGNKKFNVSATSFFQTNPKAAEKLYNTAAEYANLSGSETLWDLYCGTGTIGIFMWNDIKSLIGIEENKDSVGDAIRNARLNDIPLDEPDCIIENPNSNAAGFFTGKVRKVLWELQQKDIQSPDVVIIDPPRSGLTKKAVIRIAKFSPQKIVYISCNPATIARDGALFSQNGYELIRVRPVDMFPQTYHIESVALFEK